MNKVGRPRKELITEARTFKITPEQFRNLTKIVRGHELKKEEEVKPKDRSHVVRLALDYYFEEVYSKFL